MIVTTVTVAPSRDKGRLDSRGTVIRGYGDLVGRRERRKPVEVSPDWPAVPVPDPIHESVRRYVLNLRAAVGDNSIRSAEAVTGVNYSTLQAVLTGVAWPDAITVARTEAGFGARLWEGPVALSKGEPGRVGQ